MNSASLRPARFLVAIAATGLIGLAAAGCTSNGSPSASAPSAPAASTSAQASAQAGAPTRPTTSAPPAPAKAATTATATQARTLMFPNTNDDVEFVGYNTTTNMPEFVKVVQQGNKGANLVPDPRDPAIHELPMAPTATVRAVDGTDFPFEICPPHGCTIDLVIAGVIGHYDNSFYAHIHVNAADQIVSVEQSAY
jgi:hypothetical protein